MLHRFTARRHGGRRWVRDAERERTLLFSPHLRFGRHRNGSLQGSNWECAGTAARPVLVPGRGREIV
jgi:hypothetical protein